MHSFSWSNPSLVRVLSIAVFALFATPGNAQQKTEPFPLKIDSDLPCADIVSTHTFEGSCCSLSDRQAPNSGCELTVINGRCTVDGDIWRVVFVSTFQFNDCPESEYVIPGLSAGPPAAPPSVFVDTSGMMKPTSEDGGGGGGREESKEIEDGNDEGGLETPIIVAIVVAIVIVICLICVAAFFLLRTSLFPSEYEEKQSSPNNPPSHRRQPEQP